MSFAHLGQRISDSDKLFYGCVRNFLEMVVSAQTSYDLFYLLISKIRKFLPETGRGVAAGERRIRFGVELDIICRSSVRDREPFSPKIPVMRVRSVL